MTAPLVTIQEGNSVTEAVEKMVRAKAESIVVVEDGRPVGIFSVQDLMNRIMKEKLDADVTRIDHGMSSPAVNIDCDDVISSAVDRMEQLEISRLVVIHKGHIVGILTEIGVKYSRVYRSRSLLVKKFLVDTIAYVSFWSGLSFIINVLIVGIELNKFVTSFAIGFALSLVLGGPFGRYLDVFREKARV
jgi:predicted transcriptional regulator